VSWPDEAIVTTTIAGMAATTRDSGFEATTLFLVGPALGDPDCRRSHVYDPTYTTRFRAASEEPAP
jgi:precorrin-4/cobalt-precorrin-4 C11-methyltransferase